MPKGKKKSSIESTKNTFYGKAIENWLTNTNELGYQLPFCQILVNEGFRLVHISKHNAFEQGKDIIAVDTKGRPHIYQLKRGNVALGEWRSIVKAELEELIDLKIVHPSVNKSLKPIPYLVTNGYLEDTVRLQLDNLNAGKWKHNPIKVIVLGELLEKFLKWSYEFTPQEISNYKNFLDLYFADGKGPTDEEKIAILLGSTLQLESEKLNKEECKRNISAAILFTSYIVSPFKKEENHISIVQILVILLSYILALIEKHNLPDQYWKGSFDLVWSEIRNHLGKLETEVKEGGLDTIYQSVWDGEIAPYRKHIAVVYLLGYKLSQILESDEQWTDLGQEQYLEKIIPSLTVWGETSLLAYVFLFEYLFMVTNRDRDSIAFLVIALQLILRFNGKKPDEEVPEGLQSPYYKIETGINTILGLEEEESPVNENFHKRSFMIKPIVELFARHQRKDILEIAWRAITYIQQERFIPDQKWMFFLWHSNQGKHRMEYPKQTQSWAELKAEADEINMEEIPNSLVRMPFLIPLYLLVYPHRINTNLIKFLDQSLGSSVPAV